MCCVAGEGAVITRNRDHADDSQGAAAGVWYTSPPNEWFRVETNYDHWMPAPPEDDRRDPANNAMTAVGAAGVDTVALFKVLSINPVLNPSTVYTTVMSPALGTYQTVVRV
jgi:hypothetical protein